MTRGGRVFILLNGRCQAFECWCCGFDRIGIAGAAPVALVPMVTPNVRPQALRQLFGWSHGGDGWPSSACT